MKIIALVLLIAASGSLAILLLFTFAVYALVGYPGFFANVWPMLTLIGIATLAAVALIVLGFGAWSAGLFSIALRHGALAMLVLLLGFGGHHWMTRHLQGRPILNSIFSSPAKKQDKPLASSFFTSSIKKNVFQRSKICIFRLTSASLCVFDAPCLGRTKRRKNRKKV